MTAGTIQNAIAELVARLPPWAVLDRFRGQRDAVPERLLVLEWLPDRVIGVEATTAGSQPLIGQQFELIRPEALTGADGAQVGAWLTAELAKLRVVARHVSVVLPREATVVRRLELPNAPDDELPLLVRFQAEAKSSVPLSELAHDFVPLPPRAGFAGREVLLATVPRPTLANIRSAMSSAGLELRTVAVSSWALAELVAATPGDANGRTDTGCDVVIACNGSRLEIVFLYGRLPLFTHTAHLPGESVEQDETALLAEISRALMAARNIHAGLQLERAYIIHDAADIASLALRLSPRLGCTAVRLKPHDLVKASVVTDAGSASLAAVVGLLLHEVRHAVPAINLIAPRQQVVKPDRRKLKIAGAIAAAVMLLTIGTLTLNSYLARLDREIEQQILDNAGLDEFLKNNEPVLASHKLVRDWNLGNVFWLDQMLALTERMPGTDRIYLNALRFDPRPEALGQLKAEGFARERKDVIDLDLRLLAERDRYQVRPHAISQSPSDPEYPWRFETEIILRTPPKPAKTGTNATEKPAAAVGVAP